LPWLWNLWLDRRGRPFNPTKIVGPAALAARLSGTAPAASWLSLHACEGRWAASVWADSEPRPQGQRHRHPVKDEEGGPRAGLGRPGQTSQQPDAKSSATLAGTLAPPGLGPAEKGSLTLVGKPRTAGTLPAEQPALDSANVPHWPDSASDESHLDARLGRQPYHWATTAFKWTSRRPSPVGATHAFGRPSNPTVFSDSDRRGAAGPRPGTRAEQVLQLFQSGSYTSNGKVSPAHQPDCWTRDH
jgi:hypothetical protein